MSAFMALATLIERRTGNSGWIDVVWTLGLGLTGIAGALLPFGAGLMPRRLLVAALALAWALRLGLHIAQRTAGITEDPRYAKLKRDWGSSAPQQLARLLQMQALVSIPLGLWIVLAAHSTAPALGWQDLAGVAVFAAGLAGGAISDGQLRAFARSGAGGICDSGLWRWSRHPNYFFEWLHWFAYVCLSVGSPLHVLGWAGPVLMYVFLRYLSGIPWTEAQALRTRGEEYRRYQQRTPMLFPWFPRDAGRRSSPT